MIVGAKRTPFGTYGGKLTKSSITEIQTVAAKAALAAANVKSQLVDTVVIGNVLTVSYVICIYDFFAYTWYFIFEPSLNR